MNTRYPIILVHGLAMKDTFFLRSWGRIDRILRSQGYTVYKSNVDGFGTVEGNAAQLKAEIDTILRETGTEKVNLIAHSKGGLDRGTPIASFILRFPTFAVKYAAFWVNTAYRMLGDRAPDSFTACQQLQRTEDLAQETMNVGPGVMCQSFSAAMRPGSGDADFVMTVPLIFSRFLEKDKLTDGMVPQDSAIFGTYRGDCLDGSVSHTEIVDFMVRHRKRDKIYAFYSTLCEELVRAGF